MGLFSFKNFAVPLIEAIDNHNYMFQSHHRRVAVISYYIGKELKLSDEEMFSLVVASLFHDIGALTLDEKENIRRPDTIINPSKHCIMGASMLPSCSMFKNVSQIVRHHHIKYKDAASVANDQCLHLSHILHLADRANVQFSTGMNSVKQGKKGLEKMQRHVGKIYHPDVFTALESVINNSLFWFDLQSMQISNIFNELEVTKTIVFNEEDVIEFTSFLSRIVDYRSQYTVTHSYTVANLVDLLGKYLGFSDEIRAKLVVAGYLHDIGNLCIDPKIAEAKGVLTTREANLVKRHVFFTDKILSGLKRLRWFSEIIVWSERHHEKIDGSGYPFSLTGDSISEEVKVLAFADSISALMSKRAQRSGLDIDTTLQILRKDIAKRLSLDIFHVIEEKKTEISNLVLECQKGITKEYQGIIEEIENQSKRVQAEA